MVISYLGRGIAHELAGEPCQDALGQRICGDGTIVMALSDGAGSARWAGEAARAITAAVTEFFCGTALSELTALPAEQIGTMLLESCRNVLRTIQEARQEPDIRQFSATVVFAAVSQTQILVGNLGDGMAAVLDDCGGTLLELGPEAGPMGGNSTWFVISPGAQQHLRIGVLDRSVDRPELLVLTSDGLRDLLWSRGDGDPLKTVRELWDLVRSGDLDGDDALADILNQMAELTDERMDDWSMLLWCAKGETADREWSPVCRSMLREEEEKYGIPASTEPRPGDVSK